MREGSTCQSKEVERALARKDFEAGSESESTTGTRECGKTVGEGSSRNTWGLEDSRGRNDQCGKKGETRPHHATEDLLDHNLRSPETSDTATRRSSLNSKGIEGPHG